MAGASGGHESRRSPTCPHPIAIRDVFLHQPMACSGLSWCTMSRQIFMARPAVWMSADGCDDTCLPRDDASTQQRWSGPRRRRGPGRRWNRRRGTSGGRRRPRRRCGPGGRWSRPRRRRRRPPSGTDGHHVGWNLHRRRPPLAAREGLEALQEPKRRGASSPASQLVLVADTARTDGDHRDSGLVARPDPRLAFARPSLPRLACHGSMLARFTPERYSCCVDPRRL